MCIRDRQLLSFSSKACQASFEYAKRQPSSPLVTTTLVPSSSLNFAGTIVLPLVSIFCVYSPVNKKLTYFFPKSSNFYHFLPLIDINLPLIRKFYTISGIIATPFLMVLHCSFPCFMGILGFS